MTKKKNNGQLDGFLRRQAEKKVQQQVTPLAETLSSEEIFKVLHDLQVHQIELEMQNQELRLSEEKLTASRERYFNFYDLAPVGYFTLSDKGLVIEANITLSSMLGVDRGALLKQPINRYIHPADQDIFYKYNKRLLNASGTQVCEVRLLKKDGTDFNAKLDAAYVKESDGLKVLHHVVSDITELKQSQKRLERMERLSSLGLLPQFQLFYTRTIAVISARYHFVISQISLCADTSE